MDWIQLSLQTDQDKADFVSEVLTGLGSFSVAYLDAYDEPIFETSVEKTPLWKSVIINALFVPDVNKAYIKSSLQELCGIEDLEYTTIKDRIWVDECKKDYHAMRFGKRLWICPSWECQTDLPDKAIVINIDPGLAFGTGTHQTTQLCLEYLDKYPPIGLQVIDFGSGTGVLAIAATKLGAKSVIAVDNDLQAITATKQNLRKNECESIVKTRTTVNTKNSNVCDLLVANILANPLIELAPTFNKLLKQDGVLVLSGILKEQCENILNCYSQYLDNLEVLQQDEWCLVSGIKKTEIPVK
jgi:ribosomal protein L11 methyltransferase